eukprot:scaffold27928_cov115-Isochrysis_galbana.AAC.3
MVFLTRVPKGWRGRGSYWRHETVSSTRRRERRQTGASGPTLARPTATARTATAAAAHPASAYVPHDALVRLENAGARKLEATRSAAAAKSNIIRWQRGRILHIEQLPALHATVTQCYCCYIYMHLVALIYIYIRRNTHSGQRYGQFLDGRSAASGSGSTWLQLQPTSPDI